MYKKVTFETINDAAAFKEWIKLKAVKYASDNNHLTVTITSPITENELNMLLIKFGRW